MNPDAVYDEQILFKEKINKFGSETYRQVQNNECVCVCARALAGACVCVCVCV